MAPPSITRESFVVSAVGAMNPALHHPQWYRTIGAINDDELGASLKIPTSGTTPFASRLTFGLPILTVNCNPAQWSIYSSNANSWKRMISVASLVFAKASDTSLTAYGFIVQRHFDTEATDVKVLLASCIAELRLGFPSGRSSSSTLALSIAEDKYSLSTTIQPSILGDRTVFGSYNHQFQAFDMKEILDGRFETFLAGYEKFFADIVSAINARAAKG